MKENAEQIIKGKKFMDPNRQQILQQLRNLVDKGPDSVDSRRVLRQVLQLRPLPYELMAEFLQRHSNTAKKLATPKGREEVKRRSRKIMEFIGRPSERALDPDHIVGKAAQAIRAALGEFKEWQVDISHAARSLVERFSGNIASSNLPPGFAEGVAGSYVYAARASLFQSDDGSMRTMYELIQDKDVKHSNDAECISKGRLSDALVLMWMQSDTVELHAVEELLRRLCGVIAPDTPVSLSTYEEPRYRAALRMQFADIPVPAAIGGPLNLWPNMPEGVNAACVLIYLEAWATARSGQVIELIDFPLSLLKRD